MTLALGVAVAAGLGAVLRHVVGRLVQARHEGGFPVGTLTVNVTGSLLLGVVTGLALRDVLPPGLAVLLSVGLAGAYTTLSTWAAETLALRRSDGVRAAAGYALATAVGCLAAAGAGLGLAAL